jgi:hypothetical protein
MKVLLLVVLVTVAAQTQGCNPFAGGDETIIGYVEQKFAAPDLEGGGPRPTIMIDGREYVVPWKFYRVVSIGDIVKREKGIWSIVKKYKP